MRHGLGCLIKGWVGEDLNEVRVRALYEVSGGRVVCTVQMGKND